MIEIYKSYIEIYIENPFSVRYTLTIPPGKGCFFLQYSACIDMLFEELDFYDRIEAAKQSGVDAVEFWKWSNKDIPKLKSKLKEQGLGVSVFNLDSADEQLSWALSRGILNSGRKDALVGALAETLPVYRELNASALIVLIGETLPLPYDRQIQNTLECLRAAAEFAEKEDIHLVVEPLNDIDRKNYFLPRAKEVFELVREINSPNIKVLLDLYHEQLMAGDLLRTVRENIGDIGHIHIADAPGRHEPGTGEIPFPAILQCLKELDYKHYIGFEFRSTCAIDETTKIIRRNQL